MSEQALRDELHDAYARERDLRAQLDELQRQRLPWWRRWFR